MRISHFVIGVILMMLIITVIGAFMGDLNTQYSTPSDYNESDIELYNRLDETYNLSRELDQKLNESSAKTGFVDMLGGFVSSAVNTLKVARSSLGTFEYMVRDGTEKLGLHSPALFRVAFVSIIIILFVFAIASVMVKKDV